MFQIQSLSFFFFSSPLLLLPLFFSVRSSANDDNPRYAYCPKHNCNGVEISYPFWRLDNYNASVPQYCGYPGFGINCSLSHSQPYPILHLPGDAFYVKNIDYETNSLTLVDIDVFDVQCPRARHNLTLEKLPLNYSGSDLKLTFYFNCTKPIPQAYPAECLIKPGGKASYFYVGEINEPEGLDWFGICEEKVVATVTERGSFQKDNWIAGFGGAMGEGFVLDWRSASECGKCEDSHGRCSFTNSTQELLCFAKMVPLSLIIAMPTKSIIDEFSQMHAQSFPLPLLHSIITFIFFLITSSLSYGQENKQHTICSSSYSCGKIQNIGFPFWGGDRHQECGLPQFELECEANHNTVMKIDNHDFRVLDINGVKGTMRIARKDLEEDICPDRFGNVTLNDALFRYDPDSELFVLFYDCPFHIPPEWKKFAFSCNINGNSTPGFYPHESFSTFWGPKYPSCEHKVMIPVVTKAFEQFQNEGSTKILELLKQGFDVVFNKSTECVVCEKSGGLCWSETNLTEPTCLCRDRTYSYYCGYGTDQGNKRDIRVKAAVGASATALTAFVACVIFFLYRRRQKKSDAGSSLISSSILSYPSSITDPEKASHYFGIHVFDYNELQEATSNFDSNKELGEGGFGTVYKGKLRDGRVVAVKRLYENNYKRVEQFRNEVELLTRLHHRNLVTLYGCTSRHSRELLLVYEYIPNGTVADHLHGEHTKPGSLSWNTRMSIAIETASALTYLHNSDVIHRDVKTNNILLDNNYCVKVADFGLSRLFPTDATHVSTAPQGTPGYVDPQYHECYQLTSKSDVYSFGVVLIELISSLPAVDISRHRYEINLSNMAINKIQCNALHELVDPSLGFDSNGKVKLMITDVAELAFQCLQNDSDLRPSMQEVLEALLGIQSMDKTAGATEKGSPGDDIGLLKNNILSLSPDSVIAKWTSSSTSTTSISTTG